MSVKFEKDTYKQAGGLVSMKQGISGLKGGKHELADGLGVALTGGKDSVGTRGYLAVGPQSSSRRSRRED